MAALMAQRSPGLNKIRRELQRRRKAVNMTKGRVEKTSSSSSPLRRSDDWSKQVRRVPIPLSIVKAATKGISYVPMGEVKERCTAPPRLHPLTFLAHSSSMKVSAVASAGAPRKSTAPSPPRPIAFIPPGSADAATVKVSATNPHATARAATTSTKTTTGQERIKTIPGMTVRVRTRAGTLRPTGRRLVLWRSAVVFSDADEAGFIEVIYHGQFPRTVRVAVDDVKNMPTVAES
ncbi:hypothetical protein CFC21_015515 [Triticum aestivum]|uniref:Uncharacterized protein n=2 Tax=Triticum aestivum TaxID=4565 RepID=A0A3B6AS46_WHEAT|nr:hypothetical protein CFC21_015515 [Triticum aestivum]